MRFYVVIDRKTGESLKDNNGNIVVVNEKTKNHIDMWLPEYETKFFATGKTHK